MSKYRSYEHWASYLNEVGQPILKDARAIEAKNEHVAALIDEIKEAERQLEARIVKSGLWTKEEIQDAKKRCRETLMISRQFER